MNFKSVSVLSLLLGVMPINANAGTINGGILLTNTDANQLETWLGVLISVQNLPGFWGKQR